MVPNGSDLVGVGDDDDDGCTCLRGNIRAAAFCGGFGRLLEAAYSSNALLQYTSCSSNALLTASCKGVDDKMRMW